MAFEVTSAPPEPEHELGDAPDSSNTFGLSMTAYTVAPVPARFPTVYQAGSPPYGPIHWRPYGVAWLGPAYTKENEADVGPDQDPVNNIRPQANQPDLDGADDGAEPPAAPAALRAYDHHLYRQCGHPTHHAAVHQRLVRLVA